jgi:hypothetical protein
MALVEEVRLVDLDIGRDESDREEECEKDEEGG